MQRQQDTNKRRRSGRQSRSGRGPDAGVQVSAAIQRTCTSDYGTGVYVMSLPRHDDSDGSRQW